MSGSRVRRGLAALATACGLLALGPAPQPATPASVPASRQADRVAVLTIEGPIDAVTTSSVKRRLAQAAAGGAQAIVIDLDTPGGEVGAVLEICAAIKASAVPNTVAWVNPQAYSGGALIGLACREIVVADAASFGDALPISLNPGWVSGATDGDLRKKAVPPLLAEVVDSARMRGWDEFLVQAFVTDGVELWWVTESGIAAGQPRSLAVNEAEFRLLFPGIEPPRGSPLLAAASAVAATPLPLPEAVAPGPQDPTEFRPASPILRDLSPSLSGRATADSAHDLDLIASPSQRPVLSSRDVGAWTLTGYLTNGSGPVVVRDREMLRFGLAVQTVRTDEELRQFFGATTLVRMDPTWSEQAVRFLGTFWVRGILIVVFVLAIFIEMTSPGVIVPGVAGMVALVLLLAPAWMLGLAGWWEVVAILVGIGLLLLELMVLPGFGVFGVLGLIALFAGLVGSFIQPSGGPFPDTAARQSELARALVTVVLSLVTSGAGVGLIIRHAGRLPILSKLAPPVGGGASEEGEGLLAAMGSDEGPARFVGADGVAQTPMRPSGRVLVDDQILDASSAAGFVDPGTPIRVIRVEGSRVIVEPRRDVEQV